MKQYEYFRHAIMACVIGTLLACGGGGGSATPPPSPTPTPTPTPTPAPNTPLNVGGSIVGLLSASGLTLVNGSETLSVSPKATTFTFVNKVLPGGTYSVAIGSQPTGLTCTLNNASGTVAQTNVQSVAVNCTPVQGKSPYTVSTFAGDAGDPLYGQPMVDGVRGSARLWMPRAIAMDSVGNAYVLSYSGGIRKVSPLGVVTTLEDANGVANETSALTVDNAGNIYGAVVDGRFIYKYSPSGTFSLVTGNGSSLVPRSFGSPTGIAVDGAGTVYVADSATNSVSTVSPTGVVSKLAGSSTPGYADGAGGTARFSGLGGLAVDSAGNVYVADTGNFAIRKITSAGVVSTLVGSGPNSSGFVDGGALAARLTQPTGVALDGAGNVFVMDGNAIRKISATGTLSTLAGDPTAGYADGTGTAARFSFPIGIVVDKSGNVAVADRDNRAVRIVSPSGVVTTLAGQGPAAGLIDGTGTVARFYTPVDVATDASGNVYVADQDNHAIRKITPSGAVTTLAGGGGAGNLDATGTAARFTAPTRVATDNIGNVYAVDNGTVRKIGPDGAVTTLPLQINNTQGIAVDSAGTLYMTSSNAVFKLPRNGALVTLAGNGGAGFADGSGAAASFNAPTGIALDAAGNVYVADPNNFALRKISPQGLVTTVAAGMYVFGISYPQSVAIDGQGTVYVIAAGGVSKVTSDGRATYLFASEDSNFHLDGPADVATFKRPRGIAIDTAGNIYVADTGNNAIRKIVP